MTDPTQAVSQRRQDATQEDIKTALKFGAATGGLGFVIGSTAGVLRNTTPVLFGIGSGAQCFGLGTVYWLTRSALLTSRYGADRAAATPRERVYTSAAAGGITGAVVAMITRGRKNVLPGGVMFGLFGAAGQAVYNAMDLRNSANIDNPVQKESMLQWLSRQKWSPISALTNEQHADIIRERIFRLDVELALIDDKMAELRKQQQQEVSTDKDSSQ